MARGPDRDLEGNASVTHTINATPTFQSSLPVPDDGDPAQASAPGTPPGLSTIEEIAQTVLDNTKALESWAVSTLFPASDNNALLPATFDPRLIGRVWSRPQGMTSNEWQLVDDSIDWTDRDLFVLHKVVFVGATSGRGQSDDWNQSASISIEYQWGYLRLPGADAGGNDPRTSGATPVNNATSHAILFSSGLRLFVREGKLYAFNAHGGSRSPEFWIFASGKTTTGDGGSASADGSTTVVGGGNAVQIQGRNVDNAAPANGDALRWDSGASKWAPSAVGSGSLPGGTNGGVLAYAGGTWASTAAGSSGQLLRSNGAAAPTWVTADAAFVGAVPTSRTVSAGTGLNGGGALSANISFSVATDATLEWEVEQRFLSVVDFQGPVRSTSLDVSTTTHTLSKTGAGRLRFTNAAARTCTLPAAGSIVAGDAGLEFVVHDAARTADSANITITAPVGVVLNGTSGGSVVLDTKGGAVVLRVVGLNTWETVGL